MITLRINEKSRHLIDNELQAWKLWKMSPYEDNELSPVTIAQCLAYASTAAGNIAFVICCFVTGHAWRRCTWAVPSVLILNNSPRRLLKSSVDACTSRPVKICMQSKGGRSAVFSPHHDQAFSRSAISTRPVRSSLNVRSSTSQIE